MQPGGEQVRRFNRTVTQRVGALNDKYLARDRPLGEARLLWEIGPDGCEVRTLRSRLGLDSGHLSRLLRAPAGLMLVAYLRAEAIGCGAVKHRPGGPSDVKRMWVAPAARGLGLGRRLLAELEAEAARSGAAVARLETNRNLTEAIGLYRSAGYREVPPFNAEPLADHWFEKRLR